MTTVRPPWVIVIQLLDDAPPADFFAQMEGARAALAALPVCTQVTACCSETADAVLAGLAGGTEPDRQSHPSVGRETWGPGDYVSWEDKHGRRHYGWVTTDPAPEGMEHCAALIEDPARGRGTMSSGELWRWLEPRDHLTPETPRATL